MNNNRRLSVLFFLSVLPLVAAFAQNNGAKYVPYFRSLDARKLSVRLTAGLGSDSAKVAAIHHWITNNIRYDYRKYAASNFSNVPVNKILYTRKAICSGYSSLFSELCRYSNVISVPVSGYVRNAGTDRGDRFYMEDHEWNAVYLDNRWWLVDACFDAGYIRYFNPTVKGRLLKVVTFGKRSVVSYRPRFVREPSTAYCCKSGLFFFSDHVPSDPVWQLLDPVRTLSEAEADSSFYLGRKHVAGEGLATDRLDYERMQLAGMNVTDREIRHGFAAYQYNNRNHYPLANSFYLMAEKEHSQADLRSKDTVHLKQQCDSISIKLVMAVLHYDSNAMELGVQRRELLDRNRLKKQVVTFQNSWLIASTNHALRNLRSGKVISKRLKHARKKIMSMGAQNEKRLMKNRSFAQASPAVKTRAADSAAWAATIGLYRDSIGQLHKHIEQQLKEAYELYDTCMARLTAYHAATGANITVTDELVWLRTQAEDDLDRRLRGIKDPLMDRKFRGDSLLLGASGSFILRDFHRQVLQVRTNYARMYKLHRKMAEACTRLKRSCAGSNDVQAMYRSNTGLYRERLRMYNVFLADLSPGPAQFSKLCRKGLVVASAELGGYYTEKSIEADLNKARGKYINTRCRALLKITRQGKSRSLRLYNKVQRVRERVTAG